MRKDRTSMTIDVEFMHGERKESVTVWVPFSVFMSAVRRWFSGESVGLDGTDNAIWNALVELDAIDAIESNSQFVELCADEYRGTAYEADDYAEWIEELEENAGRNDR